MPSNREYKPKPYTDAQRRSLWLFFRQLADSLNLAGLDQRKVLKPTYNLPWTAQSIHDHIFIPVLEAMYSKKTMTKLEKLEEISNVHEVIMRELGEKHGVEYIPLPAKCEKHDMVLCEDCK